MFIENYYAQKGAKVVKCGQHYIEFYVTNFHSEIVKDSSYWEAVYIVVSIERKASSFIVNCFLDGSYSPGFNPPPEDAYSRIEHQRLDSYVKELTFKIEDDLRKKVKDFEANR